MTTSDIILLSSVSVRLLAILALAVSVWSMGQRIGASIDGFAREVDGLARGVDGLGTAVNGLAQVVAASTTSTGRRSTPRDGHLRAQP